MILSDVDILKEIEVRNIICLPFDRANLSNSSIDLRLGWNIWKQSSWYPVRFKTDNNGKLTVLNSPDPKKWEFESLKDRYVLAPGAFVLAETLEYVGSNSNRIIAQIADKSTLARLGLSVCFSAGYVDAGNALHVTLELKNNGNMPIELQYGMHICQVKFEYLSSPCEQIYKGKYLGSSIVEVAK